MTRTMPALLDSGSKTRAGFPIASNYPARLTNSTSAIRTARGLGHLIYDAPELVDRLVEVCGSFSQYIAEVFAENPSAPLMFMGEDVAGSQGPIFSLDFIRKKALPIWKRIAKPMKDTGFKFLYHTDGKAEKILPIMVNALGADGFNPIERNGCNDIFEIRRNYPRTLLFGNLCCETTLPYGTPEEAEKETLQLVERLGPSGGILIGSSSEVHDMVPVKNALRMHATVRKYGSYPINVRRS
ncbi:MAG: hypothetical protein ABSD45_12975 [Terriglobia bacterium]